MKILHISNYYHPDIGGIEQVAKSCVEALAKAGHEQRVICFSHGKKTTQGAVEGIPVTRAGSFCKVSSQSLSFSFSKLFKREFQSFVPDAVIFHYPNPFEAHTLLKFLKKYPYCRLFLWWHLDITKQKVLGKLFRGQTLRLLKRAERVVATSPNYIEGSPFLSAFKEKCTLIPLCADRASVEPTKRAVALSRSLKEKYAGKIILFALGRHVPYKGMEYLIRASKGLGGEFAVCIGGEGPLTPALKELAVDDDKVEFLGKIDGDMKQAYFLACDLFCFPSITKNEAFGLALAEAMAYSKPAVTFTIEGSGVNFVSLNNVTGLEAENRNVSAYRRAIETLAYNDSLRLEYGRNARKRYEELFTEEKFFQNVIDLFAARRREEI